MVTINIAIMSTEDLERDGCGFVYAFNQDVDFCLLLRFQRRFNSMLIALFKFIAYVIVSQDYYYIKVIIIINKSSDSDPRLKLKARSKS